MTSPDKIDRTVKSIFRRLIALRHSLPGHPELRNAYWELFDLFAATSDLYIEVLDLADLAAITLPELNVSGIMES